MIIDPDMSDVFDAAIKECIDLGELDVNCSVEDAHRIIEQYESTFLYPDDERTWFKFPQDHFYCRMANGFLKAKNYRVWKSNSPIALLIDSACSISDADIMKVQDYSKLVGHTIGIFREIGRMEPHFDYENSPEKFCEDCTCDMYSDANFSLVGLIYEEQITGEVYVMQSDWVVKSDCMWYIDYSHYLVKIDELNPKFLYDRNYVFKSGPIKYNDAEYLEIYLDI